jgi:hypothetical protein
METGTGLVRALRAIRDAGCHVVNMSYGEPTSRPSAGRFGKLVESLVRDSNVVFLSSAGNAGPALSTVGAPGGTSLDIIGVGAAITGAMQDDQYALRREYNASAGTALQPATVRPVDTLSSPPPPPPSQQQQERAVQQPTAPALSDPPVSSAPATPPLPSVGAADSRSADTSYTWSSRGPCVDGCLGVSVCAPGGAITSVPSWTLQRNLLMNGTSMSSPNCAGCVALLLSALLAQGIPYTPWGLRRALENTAEPLVGGTDIFGTGHGLVQVVRAYGHLLLQDAVASAKAALSSLLPGTTTPGASLASLQGVADADVHAGASRALTSDSPLRQQEQRGSSTALHDILQTARAGKDVAPAHASAASAIPSAADRVRQPLPLLDVRVPNGGAGAGEATDRGVYLRDSAQADVAGVHTIDVKPLWPTVARNDQKVSFQLRLALASTDPRWVSAPPHVLLMQGGRGFGVHVDPRLLAPGTAHYAEVLGFEMLDAAVEQATMQFIRDTPALASVLHSALTFASTRDGFLFTSQPRINAEWSIPDDVSLLTRVLGPIVRVPITALKPQAPLLAATGCIFPISAGIVGPDGAPTPYFANHLLNQSGLAEQATTSTAPALAGEERRKGLPGGCAARKLLAPHPYGPAVRSPPVHPAFHRHVHGSHGRRAGGGVTGAARSDSEGPLPGPPSGPVPGTVIPLYLRPGTIHRRFIQVPVGTTFCEVHVTRLDDGTLPDLREEVTPGIFDVTKPSETGRASLRRTSVTTGIRSPPAASNLGDQADDERVPAYSSQKRLSWTPATAPSPLPGDASGAVRPVSAPLQSGANIEAGAGPRGQHLEDILESVADSAAGDAGAASSTLVVRSPGLLMSAGKRSHALDLRRTTDSSAGAFSVQEHHEAVKDDAPRTIVVHAMQIERHRSPKFTAHEEYLSLRPGRTDGISFPVQHSTTLEVVIGQFWSSLGSTAVLAEVRFRGTLVEPATVTIAAPEEFVPINVIPTLGEVSIKPQGRFTHIRRFVSPAAYPNPVPLSDRDVLVNGKQQYVMELSYKVSMPTAMSDIRLSCPRLHGVLYESPFDSFLLTVKSPDSGKVIGTSDAFAEKLALPEGTSTVTVQVKHEDPSVLQALSKGSGVCLAVDMPIPRKDQAAIRVCAAQDTAAVGGRSLTEQRLRNGQIGRFFVAVPSAPLSKSCMAKAGDLLVGNLWLEDYNMSTLAHKEHDKQASLAYGRHPTGISVEWVYPGAGNKDASASAPPVPPPANASMRDRMLKGIRDAAVAVLESIDPFSTTPVSEETSQQIAQLQDALAAFGSHSSGSETTSRSYFPNSSFRALYEVLASTLPEDRGIRVARLQAAEKAFLKSNPMCTLASLVPEVSQSAPSRSEAFVRGSEALTVSSSTSRGIFASWNDQSVSTKIRLVARHPSIAASSESLSKSDQCLALVEAADSVITMVDQSAIVLYRGIRVSYLDVYRIYVLTHMTMRPIYCFSRLFSNFLFIAARGHFRG